MSKHTLNTAEAEKQLQTQQIQQQVSPSPTSQVCEQAFQYIIAMPVTPTPLSPTTPISSEIDFSSLHICV